MMSEADAQKSASATLFQKIAKNGKVSRPYRTIKFTPLDLQTEQTKVSSRGLTPLGVITKQRPLAMTYGFASIWFLRNVQVIDLQVFQNPIGTVGVESKPNLFRIVRLVGKR